MKKVHFVLDEAASLGHMEALVDAVDKGRAYGVKCDFFYQSFGQLKKCWPDGQDQTLLSNCSTIWFGVNDNETAKYVSDRIGEETVIVDNGGSSSGKSVQGPSGAGPGSVSHSDNQNSGWQQQARKLLKPEEVMALSPRIAITFTPGVPPLWTTLVRYYEESFGPPDDATRRKAQRQTKSWCVAMLLAAILISVSAVQFKKSYETENRMPEWGISVPRHRARPREAYPHSQTTSSHRESANDRSGTGHDNGTGPRLIPPLGPPESTDGINRVPVVKPQWTVPQWVGPSETKQ